MSDSPARAGSSGTASAFVPYRQQVWGYLIRRWRDGQLSIVPNGQTDNGFDAVRRAFASLEPTHVLDVRRGEIIYRNY